MSRTLTPTQAGVHLRQGAEQHEELHDDMDCSSPSMAECPSSTLNAAPLLQPDPVHCSPPQSLLCGQVLTSSTRGTLHCHQQHWSRSDNQQKAPGAAQQLQTPNPNSVSVPSPFPVPRCSQTYQQQQQTGFAPQQQPDLLKQQRQGQILQHSNAHLLQSTLRSRLKSPEISRDKLEALRAKAIASTATLTDLEPDDMHSLQLSITASQCRRGSDHAHMHSTLAPATGARRHSSHI